MPAELKKIDCTITSPELIRDIETLLAEAKAGNITSMAVVWCDNDDCTHTEFANYGKRSGIRELAAGVSLLQYKVMKSWENY
jgi:hypothetical protein